MGILTIGEIPEDFELTESQSRVRDAVVSGEPVVDRDGLQQALDFIVYPAYFLDFETVMTALPLYEGIAPYSQIVTQYSLHICDRGEEIEHKEYLAEPERNCMRELTERLIQDCGNEGSIIVYTSFERTIIDGLMWLFPDLEDGLRDITERLFDLYQVLRRYYYHPEFHGSFSIKKVLPVVVPGLGYDGMDIDNGLDASAVFAYMSRGRYDGEEMEEIRRQLLEYCKLDTLAMVRLEERLRGMV